MSNILDGRQVARNLTQEQKVAVQKLKDDHQIQPKLLVLSVGEDPASQIYIRQKERRAQDLGFAFEHRALDGTVSQEELQAQIQACNEDASIHGLILQLPLPDHLDETQAMETLDAAKDVDGFHVSHMGHLVYDDAILLPCTPRGIMHLLKEYAIDPQGQHVVIVGRSRIVGLPLAIAMINRQATVSVANSRTRDLGALTRQADILIVATGQPHLIQADMVQEGAVVIDVGIHRTKDQGLIGDVDYQAVKDKAAWITPVPGGVGPLTVAMLMQQTLIAACLQAGLDPSDYVTLN